jgi:type III pantothenate kinase
MPGLATQAKALAGSAEQLKEIEIIPKRIIAGANTADAILAGILYGAAGAVTNICKRIERNIFGCQSRIILTGGHSGLLHFAIGQDMQTELRDNLVMRGILRLLDEREELSDN